MHNSQCIISAAPAIYFQLTGANNYELCIMNYELEKRFLIDPSEESTDVAS